MKKNIHRKLKCSLICGLTIIGLSLSIVACKSNEDLGDKNYSSFKNSIDKLSTNTPDFAEKYSSLDIFLSGNSELRKGEVPVTSTVNKLNINSLKLYDLSKSAKDIEGYSFTSLKHDCILNDGDKIQIKLGEKKIDLNNVYFSSNFSLKFQSKNKQESSMEFANITAFFQLQAKKSFDVSLTPWNDKTKVTIVNCAEDKYHLDVDSDKKFDNSQRNFGVSVQNGKRMIVGKFLEKTKFQKWTINPKPWHGYNCTGTITDDAKINYSSNNGISFKGKNFVVMFHNYGVTSSTSETINSYIWGLFLNNESILPNDGNFLIYIKDKIS